MGNVRPIGWIILVAFVAAAVQAATRASTVREFGAVYLDIIGARDLRKRSRFLYWCGIGILVWIGATW
jgi:hypothetical protein